LKIYTYRVSFTISRIKQKMATMTQIEQNNATIQRLREDNVNAAKTRLIEIETILEALTKESLQLTQLVKDNVISNHTTDIQHEVEKLSDALIEESAHAAKRPHEPIEETAIVKRPREITHGWIPSQTYYTVPITNGRKVYDGLLTIPVFGRGIYIPVRPGG